MKLRRRKCRIGLNWSKELKHVRNVPWAIISEEEEADEGHPQLNQDHRALFAWINAPPVKWWEQEREKIWEANLGVYEAEKQPCLRDLRHQHEPASFASTQQMCFLSICGPFHQLAFLLLGSRRKCAYSKEPNALEMPSPPPNPAHLNTTLKPASAFQHLPPYFHTNIRSSHCCCCCTKILTNKEMKAGVPGAAEGAARCRSGLFYSRRSCFALTTLNSNKNHHHHLNPSSLLMLRLRDAGCFCISIIIAAYQRRCQVRWVSEEFTQSCRCSAFPQQPLSPDDKKTTCCCGTSWGMRGELQGSNVFPPCCSRVLSGVHGRSFECSKRSRDPGLSSTPWWLAKYSSPLRYYVCFVFFHRDLELLLSVSLPCSHTHKRNFRNDVKHKSTQSKRWQLWISCAEIQSYRRAAEWKIHFGTFVIISQPDCMLCHAFPTKAPLFNLTGHSPARESVIANLKWIQNRSPSPFAWLNAHSMRAISFSKHCQSRQRRIAIAAVRQGGRV